MIPLVSIAQSCLQTVVTLGKHPYIPEVSIPIFDLSTIPSTVLGSCLSSHPQERPRPRHGLDLLAEHNLRHACPLRTILAGTGRAEVITQQRNGIGPASGLAPPSLAPLRQFGLLRKTKPGRCTA